jgi:conjugative transposon TraN protein
MKHYWIIGCALAGITTRLQGQPMTRVVPPRRLEVSATKTSHLVFPYAIRSADRGSRDLLAEVAEGSANILRIKGAREGFAQTDLTVITTDGTLYSFLVDYAEDPDTLTLIFSEAPSGRASPGASSARALLAEGRPGEAILREHARLALRDPRALRGVKSHEPGQVIRLNGLYSDGKRFFFRIRIDNRTVLAWEGEPFRFFIRDRRLRRRTASQQQEIRPLFALADSLRVPARGSREYVFVLAHRRLSRGQCLVILFTEKNGGTPLRLRIRNRTLRKILPLIIP